MVKAIKKTLPKRYDNIKINNNKNHSVNKSNLRAVGAARQISKQTISKTPAPTYNNEVRNCVVRLKRYRIPLGISSKTDSVSEENKRSASQWHNSLHSDRDCFKSESPKRPDCKKSKHRKPKNTENVEKPLCPQLSDKVSIRKCVVRLKRLRRVCKGTAGNDVNEDVIFSKPAEDTPKERRSSFGKQSNFDDLSNVNKAPVADKDGSLEPVRNSILCIPTPISGGKIHNNICADPAENIKIQKKNIGQDIQKDSENKPGCRFFHRDQVTRSRSSVTRNVYEFLSQSDIEDKSIKDPASDIIQKMIKDGRACAMIRSKSGKSRVRPVRKKVRPVGKRKQCSVDSTVEKQAPVLSEPQHPSLSPICEVQDDDRNENDDPFGVDVLPQPPQGAYSPLAKSLLLNQAMSHQKNASIHRRRELLNMARNIVSTPLNRKISSHMSANMSDMNLSPVVNAPDRRSIDKATTLTCSSGGTSPWRVPDESPLPNTFVFGLNTSQLPSYSSDFVNRRRVYLDVPDKRMNSAVANQVSGTDKNDSNGENVPPPVTTSQTAELQSLFPVTPDDAQDNENVENIVQLPNPRRTLQHRSPLKDINILEVVELPPWKKNMQLHKTPNKSSAQNQDKGTKNIPSEPSTGVKSRQQQRQKAPNLFGFEDFLSSEEEEIVCRQDTQQNVTLHERLQRLKNFLPAQHELSYISHEPIRHDYDDLNAHGPRQRNIKEMLCSTMISKPTARVPSADDSLALFKDLDPETTFDEKKPRRTYVAERPKRKRKQRVHVLFIDTDSSEDEENEQDSKEKSSESPDKRMPMHKRKRLDAQHEAKMKQFITSFNQECAEVEKFPLIIE